MWLRSVVEILKKKTPPVDRQQKINDREEKKERRNTKEKQRGSICFVGF